MTNDSSPASQSFAMATDAALLLLVENNQAQRSADWNEKLTRNFCFIEVPQNINALKESDPSLGRLWREATRAAFLAAIEAGFTANDFLKIEESGKAHWFYRLLR